MFHLVYDGINIAGVKWVVRFQLILLPVMHVFVFYRYKHSRSEEGGQIAVNSTSC
jgi:hypothetical protein